MKKKSLAKGIVVLLAAMAVMVGCSTAKKNTVESKIEKNAHEDVTIMVAAAASLENTYKDKIIPAFQEKYPWIKVEGTYDSSGKLQKQIEEGLDADVFMSAATKQMNSLKDKKLVDEDTIVDVLENKVVLIVPAEGESKVKDFKDITNADTIAIGDPESVPAGQYAKEVLTNLGDWEEVSKKASLGTNVTEVLNWVAEKSADAGIVYGSDAISTDKVKVVAEAPEESLKTKVIYPAAVVTNSKKKEAAQLLVDFLTSDEVSAIFKEYGFTPNK
ncbi:molybdate ABC transporter substrate-binding protein [Clostridium faecium]|uniref:Molybdate ABC transporter substrate-binding protein n=1 Tax=Clostridium faecium TaxID=2762223 RepID=A0ABR8YPX8_9CLOT|nr:molybdate ABC transporter substrate-binding protein [Clostridium faecium]MBD8046279.1 molybdate ABC transporter substrate-binding protein [Clostridium faecium]MDU1349493.1 molybdate ABC transporter substrate-binding protein [Clostridium argentinense]